MSKSTNDLTTLVEKKMKDLKRRSPQQAKNPKVVEKKIKQILTEKPKKEQPEKKKKTLTKKEIVKKVAALIN